MTSARPAATFVAVSIASTLLSTACRQIVGFEDADIDRDSDGSARTGAQVCGLASSGTNEACAQCMGQLCCEQAKACVRNEGCPAIEACVRACAYGDAPCAIRCNSGHGTPSGLQTAVESCRVSSCAQACVRPPWECLGDVEWTFPSVTPPIIAPTAWVGSLSPTGTYTRLADVTVRVCSLVDPKCESPLAIGHTGTDGSVILPIDAVASKPPLSLFLELRKDEYLDTLLLLSTPPVASDIQVGGLLFRPEDAATMSAPTINDPTRAIALVRVVDCNGAATSSRSGAVELSWLDKDEQTILEHATPNVDFYALNLPINAVGISRVVARMNVTQQLVAAASLPVRPNTVTLAELAPIP